MAVPEPAACRNANEGDALIRPQVVMGSRAKSVCTGYSWCRSIRQLTLMAVHNIVMCNSMGNLISVCNLVLVMAAGSTIIHTQPTFPSIIANSYPVPVSCLSACLHVNPSIYPLNKHRTLSFRIQVSCSKISVDFCLISVTETERNQYTAIQYRQLCQIFRRQNLLYFR